MMMGRQAKMKQAQRADLRRHQERMQVLDEESRTSPVIREASPPRHAPTFLTG